MPRKFVLHSSVHDLMVSTRRHFKLSKPLRTETWSRAAALASVARKRTADKGLDPASPDSAQAMAALIR